MNSLPLKLLALATVSGAAWAALTSSDGPTEDQEEQQVIVGPHWTSDPAVPATRETYFKGYLCTKDCPGHDAGYAWAKKKGIKDRAQCSGNSRSFIEGCWAFAEEK